MNLLLCEPDEVDQSGVARIEGERAEHLRKILKRVPGEKVAAGIVGQGRGTARILDLRPGHADLQLSIDHSPGTPYPLQLAVGMVRPIQIRRILKSTASFGITAIHFIPTALGEDSYRRAGIWHDCRTHLLEGAAQGGLAFLPDVMRHESLGAFLQLPFTGCSRRFFDPGERQPLPESDLKQSGAVILIGSERGWSDAERSSITAAGYRLHSLGDRILTTETACTAATAITLRELRLV